MNEILDMAIDEGDEDMYGEEEIDFSAVTGPVVYTRSHIIGTPEGRELCHFAARAPPFASGFLAQVFPLIRSCPWCALW